jgi:hypothetical protein
VDEVVARAPQQSRQIWVTVGIQALLAVVWVVRFLLDGDRVAAVLAGCFVVLLLVGVVLALAPPALTLTLTDDALVLTRRRRPLHVARGDVRAVRGDVPNRPSWSGQVVVETRDGRAVRLPRFDVTPGALIPRLQDWAGVGERPAPEDGEPHTAPTDPAG